MSEVKTHPLEHRRHWDALATTDQKYTKPFKRQGGFEGTAVNPTYCLKKMTEHFGPCGLGWGFTKPEFTVHTLGESVLVFCEVAVWYQDPASGKRSDLLYGRGGDYISVKRKDWVATDDEGYKKAQTDAIGNALKLIGMSADVHLGLYDDNKYVQSLKQAQQEDRQGPATKAVDPAKPPETKPRAEPYIINDHSDGLILAEYARARDWCFAILEMVKKAPSKDKLAIWQANQATLPRIESDAAAMKPLTHSKAAQKFVEETFKKQLLQLLPTAVLPAPKLARVIDDEVPF